MLVRPPFRMNGGYIVPAAGLTGGSADYITRTFTLSATQSGSMWLKRATLGAVQPVLDGKIYFDASNKLVAYGLTSSAVFRDPTAWLHIFWNTSGVWVNGASISGTGTYATTTLVNPRLGYDGTNSADAYFADFVLWDGSSVSLDGGATDTYGNWSPKRPGNSPTDWIADISTGVNAGSAGDWTVTGTIAQVSDTPTDSAARGVGNFATFNPLRPPLIGSGLPTRGNLRLSAVTGQTESISTLSLGGGNTAAEMTVDTRGTSGLVGFGVGNISASIGSGSGQYIAIRNDGSVQRNTGSGASTVASYASYTTGDIIRLEATATEIEFFKNGTSMGAAVSIGLTDPGDLFVIGMAYNNGGQAILDFDFGQLGFSHALSAGFSGLATQNLPSATAKLSDRLQIALDTEADIAASLATARSGWSGYVDILKNRTTSETWAWRFSHDSGNEYAVSTTATYQANRTLAGSDDWVGYSINIGAAHGTAAGSQAHTNGAATTVTHNLGEARAAVFLFPRSNGNVYVYHPDLSSGKLLVLNADSAEATNAAITGVGANSFDIGSAAGTDTYDYLVLAENDVIRLFDYTGNASANGPVANLDGQPVWMLTKNRDHAVNWLLQDTARSVDNPVSEYLAPSAAVAEDTVSGDNDFLGTGFKVRNSSVGFNGSGETMVGVAFVNPMPRGRGQTRGLPR